MHVDMGARLEHPSLKDKVSKEEWATRVELAAFFRLIDHFGYNQGPGNHLTARVPGEPDHFLINPAGRMFGEVTASSLVKIDFEGNELSETLTGIVNHAGYLIHSAIFMARPDVNATAHLHTVPGVAVSAQKDGFRFISQESMRFYSSVSYHDYEGIARDMTERDRLREHLGNANCMVLRNHGSLLCGQDIPEAFSRCITFERAAAIQVAAEASGRELTQPSEEVCLRTFRIGNRPRNMPGSKDTTWQAYRRIVDAHYPSYLS
jgi:ribulose-5-phosphate 4-epimerase/fuculose-1-phosphate aldolase